MLLTPILASLLIVMRKSHRIGHRALERGWSRLVNKPDQHEHPVRQARSTYLWNPRHALPIGTRRVWMIVPLHFVQARARSREVVGWWSGVHGLIADGMGAGAGSGCGIGICRVAWSLKGVGGEVRALTGCLSGRQHSTRWENGD